MKCTKRKNSDVGFKVANTVAESFSKRSSSLTLLYFKVRHQGFCLREYGIWLRGIKLLPSCAWLVPGRVTICPICLLYSCTQCVTKLNIAHCLLFLFTFYCFCLHLPDVFPFFLLKQCPRSSSLLAWQPQVPQGKLPPC